MSIDPKLRELNIDLPACPATLVKLSLLMADEQVLHVLRHARGRFGSTLDYLADTAHAIERRGGERIVVPILASDRPEDLGEQDLLVLAVKGPALAAVALGFKAGA